MYGMVNKILVLVVIEHRVGGCGIASVRESWLRCASALASEKDVSERQ